MKPVIGNWYRIQGSERFEVVAFDEDDGTIELQYFDGTVEEMDIEDWQAEQEAGTLEEVEAPEDWTGSVDVDPEEDDLRGTLGYGEDEDRRQSANRLEGLDLFE
ncbi:MAG TPA: DUF6763 family protein [Steroidobacteraceae bacterium]|jgi:hypothetical protein